MIKSDFGNLKVKTLLSMVVLGTSFYYSVLFTLGVLVGYFISKLFCNALVNTGKVDSIFISAGKWTFHLHHWIMGLVVLTVAWIVGDFHLSAVLTGFLCGVIVHDIYDTNDWYKVIVKNPEYQKESVV